MLYNGEMSMPTMKILWFLIQVINYHWETLNPSEVHYVRKVGTGNMARGETYMINKMKAQSVKYNLAKFLRPSAWNNKNSIKKYNSKYKNLILKLRRYSKS